MGRRQSPDRKLTPLEALIMNVLWDESPAAVKRVQERLEAVKPMAYSTVLTMMRILRDKGFLASERKGKADHYRPVVSREVAARRSLGDVIDSFFSGSAQAFERRGADGDPCGAEQDTAPQEGWQVVTEASNHLGSELFGLLAVLVLLAGRVDSRVLRNWLP